VRNDVHSTWANVLLGDEYGHAGGYPKFIGNTFRREGDDPAYRTIFQERGRIPATGVFMDNKYEDGASPENIELKEMGRIVMQRFVTVRVVDGEGKPLGDARVVVSDAGGKPVHLDTTPAAETLATIVADGERLAVIRPSDSKHRGYCEDALVGPGEVAVVLTREVVTADGRKPAGSYTVSAKKEGYKAASRTVDVAKADRVEIVLEK